MRSVHTDDTQRPTVNVHLKRMDEDEIERHPAPGYRCDDPDCAGDHEHQRVTCAGCERELGYVEVSERSEDLADTQ